MGQYRKSVFVVHRAGHISAAWLLHKHRYLSFGNLLLTLSLNWYYSLLSIIRVHLKMQNLILGLFYLASTANQTTLSCLGK